MYRVNLTERAENDVRKLKKSEPAAFKKLLRLIAELEAHPKTGTGKPERLIGRENEWSRRITDKHRLIYSIKEEIVSVFVISSYGHYGDK